MFPKTAILMIAGLSMIGYYETLAQNLNTGPQVLTIFSNVDDSEQPYGLYLPKHFNPSRKYPLVIMLHGAYSNHRLALRRVFGLSNINGETDVEATRYFPQWRDIDYIVATPLARGTMGYQGIAEKDVYDVLADVERRFPIDKNRVYLTGLSMGGGGTLWLGLTRPDIWAAIAPVCPAPPAQTKSFAPNALNFPVSFHQGGADPVVNPKGTRDWSKLLKDLGTMTQYTEYPGVGHNSWEEAYKDEAIFRWFSKFRRNPLPNRVRFVTDRYKYQSAYWVAIDDLTPGIFASIDAKFTGLNKIEIQTSNLRAFTLNVKGHSKFRSDTPLAVTIGGKTMTAETKGLITFILQDSTWATQLKPYMLLPGVKGPNAEGPISEAFASRHVYVYGTRGEPSPQEMAARRSLAADAAKWQAPSPLLYFPRVISDREVRPSDIETSNLILFGTGETNSMIKKFTDKVPIQLTGADSSYGLVYIYPEGEHYVVVCSGKPWWTMDGTNHPNPSRGGFRFFSGPVSMLMGLGDFAMYKNSLDQVVSSGVFDNGWRLSKADSAKMDSTGCIKINDNKTEKGK
jgi:poly(3-hydroxybutyrate) depolymerase